MKLWIDDLRPAPPGWIWARSVDEAKVYTVSRFHDKSFTTLEIVSLDHDAGDYNSMGGDYINYLNWLEEFAYRNHITTVPMIHIHTANPVGAANMRRIIRKNGWKEIYEI